MSKTTIAVDAARLPILLTELHLPTFARMWPGLAETADTESWPAARFLAALAEHEVAERMQRRIARHAQESRLPPGKTFDAFDFAALPMIGKARFLASPRATPGSTEARTSCSSAHPASARAISERPSATLSSTTAFACSSSAPQTSSRSCSPPVRN